MPLDEIAAVDGASGQSRPCRRAERLRRAVDQLRETGKPAGILATNPEDAGRYRDWGYQFVAAAVDLGLLVKAGDALATQMK